MRRLPLRDSLIKLDTKTPMPAKSMKHEIMEYVYRQNSLAGARCNCWPEREEVSSLVEAGGTVFDAPISTETEVSVTPS